MELEYELQTHRAEERHWWYRGRRRVLERAIERLGLPEHARILDAGCGSGRNMVELARHGVVTGVELSGTSVQLARERDVGEVLEGSVMDMPFDEGSFDLTVSLDVIEHLEDDVGALRELRRVTKPGGALLVTVPAYQWLWSGHDVINQHHRRYNRRTLLAAAESAGWHSESSTHFNSLLLPPAMLLRVLERFKPSTTKSSLDLWIPPAPLNWALRQPLILRGRRHRAGRPHSGRTVAARRVPLKFGLGLVHAGEATGDSGNVAVAGGSCLPEKTPYVSMLVSASAAGVWPLNVHARLARNVTTVTITIVTACPTSSSRPMPSTNRYTRPRFASSPLV